MIFSVVYEAPPISEVAKKCTITWGSSEPPTREQAAIKVNDLNARFPDNKISTIDASAIISITPVEV